MEGSPAKPDSEAQQQKEVEDEPRSTYQLLPKATICCVIRALCAEFIGDVIFVYIGILQAVDFRDFPPAGIVSASFAHGLAIFVLIAGMGHISGGHFNPCVTLGVLVSGNIAVLQAVMYWMVQLLGGFVGALLARASIPYAVYKAINGGATLPNSMLTVETGTRMGPTGGQGIAVELMLTYLLVLTVLLTAVDTDKNALAPLAIGLSITAGIYGGGAISGASLNLARTMGPAVAASIFGVEKIWDQQYIYYAGDILGAILAGATYKLVLAADGKRWFW